MSDHVLVSAVDAGFDGYVLVGARAGAAGLVALDVIGADADRDNDRRPWGPTGDADVPRVGPADDDLDMPTARIVVDAADPELVIELSVDRDSVDTAGRLARAAVHGSRLTLDGERVARLGRLALALDEHHRADRVDGAAWAVDAVVLADGLGLPGLARRYAPVAVAALLAAPVARLHGIVLDALHTVARYADTAASQRLAERAAAGAAAAPLDPLALAHAGDRAFEQPAMAERAGSRRVAGAIALHVGDLVGGLAVDRRARLTWRPDEGRLAVEIDGAGRPAETWFRLTTAAGTLVALAPVAWELVGGSPDVDRSDPTRRLTGSVTVALHASNDLTSLVADLVADPAAAVVSSAARARQQAIASGRRAAQAARTARWAVARDGWLVCARAWDRAGDLVRGDLARTAAAVAFDRLGDRAEADRTRPDPAAVPTGWSVRQRPTLTGSGGPAFAADVLAD